MGYKHEYSCLYPIVLFLFILHSCSSALGHKFLRVFFTPKGCIMRAQGNALGKKIRALSRPEGAHYQLDECAPSGRETFPGL